ncbi:MAG: penicillin-insensitive murein endopeptidase [Myxococcales bacterium]|nr:penicillin-insensitive murein endopeptidase [Myxococcales bacterium]
MPLSAKFRLHRVLLAILALGVAQPSAGLAAEVPRSVRDKSLEILLPQVVDPPPEDDAAAPAAEEDDTDGADAADAAHDAEHEEASQGDDAALEEEDAGAAEASGEEPPLPGARPKSRSSRSKSKSTSKKKMSASRESKPAAAPKRPKGAKECDYRTPIYEHEVVKGEHLGAIAGRYGVRRADILALNDALKKNPNLLRPGQKLRVCPEIAPRTRQEIEHVVAKGENPTLIAKKYGITVDELLGLQRGKLGKRLAANPRSLQIGDRMVVLIDVEEKLEFAPAEETRGILRASVQLPTASKHYLVKRPYLAYGTPRTIKAIQAAISRYKQRKPAGPKVHVGDISKKGGGPLKPHRSHQKGVDVDIGLVHKGILAGEKRFVAANAQTLDVARTWALIKAFADTKEVRAIFLDYQVQKTLYEYARRKGVSEETLDELFQYPRGKGRGHGLIRHWNGHRNHFHVRFRG